jgi:fumarate reductase flavoprotein subunit
MKVRKLILFVGIVALLTGAFWGCASAPVTPIGNATGTATGTAPGYGGDIVVTVTMADGFITDVKIVGDKETQSIAGPAITRAPNMIKRYNSAQFDAVSGATVTSMGISAAAQNAIDQIAAGH